MTTNKNLFIALAIIFIIFSALLINIKATNQEFSNLNFSLKAKPARTYRIGFITDIHAKKTNKNEFGLKEHFRRPMMFFIDHMNNKFRPHFVVQGGDFIDGSKREGKKSIDDFNTINSYYSRIKSPQYHMIGNHDMRGLTTAQWMDLTKNKNTYYYFDHEDIRTIVLNGQEEEKDGVRPPFLSEDQFEWLEDVLNDSGSFRNIIVFSHYPPTNSTNTKSEQIVYTKNSARLISLFSKYGVSAVISGHVETLDFTEIEGVRYFTIPGLFRSKYKKIPWYDVFAEIYVKNRVKVAMFYKKSSEGEDEYKILHIPSREYEEIEK